MWRFFDNYGGADVVKLETVPKLICLANQIEELMLEINNLLIIGVNNTCF